MLDRLYVDLADGDLRLFKLTQAHRETLRAVCAADGDVWEIYSSSFGPDHFDQSFDALIGGGGRMPYAIIDGDRLIGMTAWLRPDWSAQTVEIGNSYIHPAARGTGFNGRLKKLMNEVTRLYDLGDLAGARALALQVLASEQVSAFTAYLQRDMKLEQVQIDEFWSFIRKKRELERAGH